MDLRRTAVVLLAALTPLLGSCDTASVSSPGAAEPPSALLTDPAALRDVALPSGVAEGAGVQAHGLVRPQPVQLDGPTAALFAASFHVGAGGTGGGVLLLRTETRLARLLVEDGRVICEGDHPAGVALVGILMVADRGAGGPPGDIGVAGHGDWVSGQPIEVRVRPAEQLVVFEFSDRVVNERVVAAGALRFEMDACAAAG